MLKKNFLLSLVIFQGILIVIAIIAIIIGVFYKFGAKENSQYIPLSDINVEEISLLDEKYYQHKIIKDDKIIFQIIDIENNKIEREIIIEK